MSAQGEGITERLLRATFVLAGGKTFKESGQSNVVVEGLRINAKIVKAGGPSMGTVQLQAFGITLSIMNQLSTLGMLVTTVQRNSVTLEAGDATNGMAVVFEGTITAAWPDFQGMPNTALLVEAHTGLADAVTPTKPTSINGSGDVATLMSGFAAQMGLTFENSGVTGKLSNPYFPGSVRDQAFACAKAAGISISLDDPGKLAIWPKLGARGGAVPLISKDTGLVKFPEYTAQGIKFSVVFNPSITFGGKVQIKSQLFDSNNNPLASPADGIWAVFKLDHDLSCRAPNGPWFSNIEAYNPAFSPPVST